MRLKYPIIALLFFILTLLQNNVFAYFKILGATPNLILVLFFILIFFEEKNQNNLGFFSALVAGFFLDITLPYYFGASIITLLIIYFLGKFFSHFLKESERKFTIFYFAILFLGCFTAYSIILQTHSLLFGYQLNHVFDINVVYEAIYNLIIACAGFYVCKSFIEIKNRNQLRLL